MKESRRRYTIVLSFLAMLCMTGISSHAAPTNVSPSPNSFGEIERITLNNPADVYSGGVIVVGGGEMIIPKNLLIDLPANRLSLQQIFDQAPAACKALGESGLAKADRCNATGSGGIATLSALRTNAGNVIIGDLFIQKAAESVNGVVTYINYNQGYYRVNGLPNDPNTGAMVRLNDPTSRHTIQSGAGCAGGPNCSPDPRFTLDPDNYTNTFATGYPVCIPSTVSRPFPGLAGVPSGTAVAGSDGTGDLLCPSTNRTPGVLNEPAVADSRRFAPVMVGDSVLAEGNYESINGVRFLSAHTSVVQKALATRNVAGQPDYLFLEEVGLEAPAFQNQRLVNLIIGFTTLAPTDVDIWSIHRDPVNNATHEFPFASVLGCDTASGNPGECSSQGLVNAGANIFKINYKVDFVKGPDPRLSPCAHLLASRFATTNPGLCTGGATSKNDFAVLSPVPHEIIARTGHKITSPAGSLITIDINGNTATNGEYLFPLGLNLGGLGVAEMSEIDLNALNTPVIFEGIPWNLDRRLGPAGCLNGGCEAGAVGSAAFALDPFPFSGLDPRTQASLLPTGSYGNAGFTSSLLSDVRNRIFSYFDTSVGNFNGNTSVLPYALGTFPADPPLTAINPTPPLSSSLPIAVADAASTTVGVPVTISVLANDTAAPPATIDPTTVAVTAATGGSAAANLNGTVTFTPPAAPGTYSFTYTVKDNSAPPATSNSATVTVTTAAALAPVAVADAATTVAGTAVTIPVLSNDTISPPEVINAASLVISTPALNGTAVANPDGTVTFTPAPGFTGKTTFAYTVNNSSVPASASNAALVTVTVTLAPPTGTIVINGGAPATRSASVALTLSATSPNGTVTQMQFSKDGGATWFPLETFATTRVVTLLGAQGTNTIWVRFRDASGTLSPIYSDSIIFDTVAPSGTIAVSSPNPTTLTTGTLSLTATDSVVGSGVTKMQFSTNSGGSFFPVESFATTRNVSLPIIGVNNFTVRFLDAAGNVSGNQSVTITRVSP